MTGTVSVPSVLVLPLEAFLFDLFSLVSPFFFSLCPAIPVVSVCFADFSPFFFSSRIRSEAGE